MEPSNQNLARVLLEAARQLHSLGRLDEEAVANLSLLLKKTGPEALPIIGASAQRTWTPVHVSALSSIASHHVSYANAAAAYIEGWLTSKWATDLGVIDACAIALVSLAIPTAEKYRILYAMQCRYPEKLSREFTLHVASLVRVGSKDYLSLLALVEDSFLLPAVADKSILASLRILTFMDRISDRAAALLERCAAEHQVPGCRKQAVCALVEQHRVDNQYLIDRINADPDAYVRFALADLLLWDEPDPVLYVPALAASLCQLSSAAETVKRMKKLASIKHINALCGVMSGSEHSINARLGSIAALHTLVTMPEAERMSPDLSAQLGPFHLQLKPYFKPLLATFEWAWNLYDALPESSDSETSDTLLAACLRLSEILPHTFAIEGFLEVLDQRPDYLELFAVDMLTIFWHVMGRALNYLERAEGKPQLQLLFLKSLIECTDHRAIRFATILSDAEDPESRFLGRYITREQPDGPARLGEVLPSVLESHDDLILRLVGKLTDSTA